MNFKIELLQGEYWWGGAIIDGVYMPFSETEFKKDLKKVTPNQGMPLLLSNKGRYIWSDYPFQFTFSEGILIIEYEYGNIDLKEGFSNLKEAYLNACSNHFPPAEKHPHELNFLVPQYNTWIEMHYHPTEEKVLDYAKEILRQGMPPGVLMIDDNWMMDYGRWDFNPQFFKDPKGMIKKLHGMGFKIMLWVCPYISADGIQYKTLNEKGYLIKKDDGTPLLRNWWNGYSCVLDFSNEDTIGWFQEQLDYLVEIYGVDGFKFDAGDPIDKSLEKVQWNKSIYPNEDCKAYSMIGTKYPFNEFRESWKAAGKPLIQRQQDKAHSWDQWGLASLIPNGLAQSIVGYAFNCPDLIGGGMDTSFEEDGFKIDQELFVRYVQCSTLFPIMQFSLAPWKALDHEHFNYCMSMVRLREKYGPKILELAKEASVTGEPIIRPMEYVFPNCGLEKVTQQFMLGDNILVAPVVEKGATIKTTYFPEGTWKDEEENEIVGPAIKNVEANLEKLPYFIRM